MSRLERFAEAMAIARRRWPVETAQAGGHLEREITDAGFGRELSPRQIAQRWYRGRNEPATPVHVADFLPDPEIIARNTERAEARREITRKITRKISGYTFTPARVVAVDPGKTPADMIAAFEAKLAAVKSVRQRARKVDPAAYAAAGARALLAQPGDAGKRPCIVRLYYRSLGGEMIACDSEPMSPHAAGRMRDAARDRNNVVPDTDADIFPVGEARSLRRGARLVVYPSQRAPVEAHEHAQECWAGGVRWGRSDTGGVRWDRSDISGDICWCGLGTKPEIPAEMRKELIALCADDVAGSSIEDFLVKWGVR